MMRTNLQPLAHLVDAAAEKWLAAVDAPAKDCLAVREEITGSFRIGENLELTFHGLRYQLRICRHDRSITGLPPTFHIHVHEIVTDN